MAATVSMSELWTLLNAEVPRWLKFMLAVSPCCWAGLGLGGEQLQSSEWHRDTTERGLLYWGLQIFCGENSHIQTDSNHIGKDLLDEPTRIFLSLCFFHAPLLYAPRVVFFHRENQFLVWLTAPHGSPAPRPAPRQRSGDNHLISGAQMKSSARPPPRHV